MKTYDNLYRPNVDTNFCCAQCKNAVGGCSWSRNFEPIPGWLTEPSQNRDRNDGLKILWCPEFAEGDPLDDHRPNDEGLMNLACAIFEQAASDYKAAIKRHVEFPSDTDTLKTIVECELFLGKHAERLKRQIFAELGKQT